jgi:hypothetical protein
MIADHWPPEPERRREGYSAMVGIVFGVGMGLVLWSVLALLWWLL